ncbi:MAG: tRNA dihydrouridine synthase DusB [Deltaproteobacteria bacterium CG11_big_fil_rev_8_21_14_0_20_45_16]|nr:MAG: tRNA dihydrouridine synthase DusB [Deltaproteobacteria bacterium CG11_big_fil_rev_8_21_14_0_20_45_16]
MHNLGPFELETPFVLAPMAGITNSPFRQLMRRVGASVVVSELASANGLEYDSGRTRELLEFREGERPVGLQIFSERSELLVKAAQYIEKLGADFVDLNLGCPVSKIVKKGAGSVMCRNPVELGKVLSAMVRAVKFPVTIKIRSGWNAESVNALEVVRVAEDVGITWVAIHARTRAQGYSGEADWELIGNIKSKVKIPILGNGDINTPEKAVERLKTYAVDAVMIGRGALRNPFIFRQARELLRTGSYAIATADEYFALMDLQKKLLEMRSNARSALLQSKKFLIWYSAGFPHCKEFRQKTFSLTSFEEVWVYGREFFETHLEGRDFEFLKEDFLMGGHG